MKLLIIDDEKLTREGIISNINWNKLGIDEIYEADDGINGIKQAKNHKPDIILSDIRMPRMNGIEMSKEIHKIIPSTSIIFMSGYSDKEYLKAAISLKVISYVEKPINALEIEDAIKSAIEIQALYKKNQITINNHYKYTKSKLALEITHPPVKNGDVNYQKSFQEFGFQTKTTTEFTTIIITLRTVISNILDKNLNELYLTIENITKKYRMNYILGIKNDEYIILHLFTNDKTTEYSINNICSDLSSFLSKSFQYFISVGKKVTGIKNVHESYNLAVSLLQSSFFYEYNSIIVTDHTKPVSINYDQNLISEYQESLNHHDKETAIKIVTNLYEELKNNQHVLPNYARDVYYKLFTILYDTASNFHISTFYDDSDTIILDYVSKDNHLVDINQILMEKINLFHSSLQEQNKENTTIYNIKEFIGKNYSNETLSVKDISQHVYLSSTYVCTIFKNETGKTLNQYLTEFRIEKAKNMLKDSRFKITDISSKVGYSDSNYFGKTFKKLVGLSPSEYRERFGK